MTESSNVRLNKCGGVIWPEAVEHIKKIKQKHKCWLVTTVTFWNTATHQWQRGGAGWAGSLLDGECIRKRLRLPCFSHGWRQWRNSSASFSPPPWRRRWRTPWRRGCRETPLPSSVVGDRLERFLRLKNPRSSKTVARMWYRSASVSVQKQGVHPDSSQHWIFAQWKPLCLNFKIQLATRKTTALSNARTWLASTQYLPRIWYSTSLKSRRANRFRFQSVQRFHRLLANAARAIRFYYINTYV